MAKTNSPHVLTGEITLFIYLFICGTLKHFGMQKDPDSLDREEYEIIVCSLMAWIESLVLCEQFQSDKDIGSLLQSWVTVNSVV